MKRILSILFLLISFISQAQLDTEHWFAPMFDRHSASGYFPSSSRQYLFLSTNETVPFDVEVYSGNRLLTTIKNLKKGNPQYYSVSSRNIISKKIEDLGKKGTMGLYVKGPKKFFANLRFSTYNHAEILTSKGLAGIGTKFYAVVAPIAGEGDNVNFMVSVLATENDTRVKISGYNPNVILSKITPTPASIEITLNKGESYIIEGDDRGANKKGFIGAKIESNKPISVTNGNFNGQYVNRGIIDGTDIIMDQSVPVDRLGNEFAIIKGNGDIGIGMEGALIVATEDNTEIYINDEVNPVITLNEGQHYVVNDSKFVKNGNHYNLYVKSSKNIYLYQLLAGTATSVATLGFNYIPPLNCFLPHQIGEIGLINKMYGEGDGNLGEYYEVPTKLNFITMKGATVNIEGIILSQENGPFDIKGTNDWVTYSIPGVKGNINITSTRSITAGISAGSGFVGYGGYFAGFSSVVTVKKNGECLPHLTLEVNGDYDAYQWKKDGINIPNATSKIYKPTTPGNYSVEVTSSTCTQITAETTVLNCPVETTINETICKTKTFESKFSTSTQRVDLLTLQIVTQPKKGKLTVDKQTGQIIYTPNNIDEVGEDVFSYKFCGTDKKFPDCEQITVNVNLAPIHLTPSTISVCSVNDMGVFDLTTAKIGHKTGDVVKYYPTEHDANAETHEITQPNSYSSAQGKVYAKVTSQGGCSAITEITLKFYDKPTVNINNYNASHCDINFDGKIEIDFSKVTSQIVNPQAGYSVKYYASQNDANNNQGALPNNWSYAQNTAVFVKVTSKEGCSIVETINFTIKDRLNLIKNKAEITLCDTDFDAITEVNLADYIQQFTNENVSATYYLSLADAQKAINAIPSNQKAKNQQKYYIRLGNATHCDNIAEINFKINTPKKSTTLKDVSICSTDTTILEAGAEFAQYLWSTGETTSNITAKVGEYWVDLTTDTGCTYRQHVKVIAVESPKILSIDIKENTATILVEGGTPPYEYSLDGRNWQTSNIFTNLQQGKKYTVFVRSKGGCEPVSQDFVIIKLVNLITPNGDGFNDVIDYSALTTKANAKFNVYDRYGALVFEGNSSNQFIWDGKAKGRPLPTASYWYLIEWQEPNTNTWVKTASWILLKNRE